MREQKLYHILIIEDNHADAALIEIYLRDIHLPSKILHASFLQVGIQMVYDHDVDIVLLDLTLPDSERHTTLKRFFEKVPDVPVIVMTGFKDEIVGIQSVRAGAQDFLVKGEFDSKVLFKSIKYSLQRYDQHSKLQRTAQTLSLNQENYRVVQRMAKIANWDMDIVTYRMTWTEEMFHILGIPPQHLQPKLKDYLNLVHVEDKEAVETFFDKAVKDGQVHGIKHRVLINNRKLRYLSLQARIKYDQLNDKIQLIGSIQDITEHRVNKKKPPLSIPPSVVNSENNIIKKISQYQLTQLHSILQSYTKSLKEQEQENTKDLLKPIILPLNNLLHSIFQLYHLSQLLPQQQSIPLKEKVLALKDLFHQFEQLAEIIQYSGLNLSVQLDPNLPKHVIGHAETLEYLIITLLNLPQALNTHSVHFNIYIKRHSIEDNDIVVQATFYCQNTKLDVEKVESLINSNKLEQLLFDNQTEEWPIILAIAQKLTKELNGITEFQSEEQKGCQVKLQIPISIIPHEEDKNNTSKTLRVLLVEDHAITQIVTKRMLATWSDNITVDIANNGAIGTQMFKEKPYDIVLMDLHMPVMDGIKATELIRLVSNTPIIALTTKASSEEKAHCLDIGMNDYLPKPIDSDQLFDKISKLTGRNLA